MKAWVMGIGWVTAAGIGRGRRGDRFDMPAGELPALTRKDIFAEPYPRFGRLDEFSRLGLAGIALALSDAGLDQWQQKRNIGIFAGTTCGCLGTDIAYFDTVLPEGGALASPNLFAYTLSNTFLGEAAIRFGLTGPNFVANLAGDNPLDCLHLALESLAWNESPLALAGICDLVTPEGFTGRPPLPGAVFLVLSQERPVGIRSYGNLSIDAEDRWRLNDIAVADWEQLIGICLPQVS